MEPQSHLLIANLEKLFASQERSDYYIQIIETKNNSVYLSGNERKTRKRSSLCIASNLNEIVFCVLPVHSCVLILQSEYFHRMFASDMSESQEKVLKIKVEEGEGPYMKLFIQAFYDHKMFVGMVVFQLLRIIEIADRYVCSAIIQQAISKLHTINVRDIDECDNVVQRIRKSNYGLPLMIQASKLIIQICLSFVTAYFVPFEMKMQKNFGIFQTISFDLLLELLKSKEALAFHENTVLYFINSWLKFDISRETKENIKSLLCQVNYSSLTPDFLTDVIAENNKIFKKWKGYQKGFLYSLAYHAHFRNSPSLPENSDLMNCLTFRKRYQSISKKPVVYKIRFEKLEGHLFRKQNKSFVFKGYEICPIIEFSQHCREPNLLAIGLTLKTLNFRTDTKKPQENEDYLIFMKSAIGIQGSESSDEDIDCSIFEKLSKKNCMGHTILFFTESTKYWVGNIEKKCLDNWNVFFLFFSFLEDYEIWPKTYPETINDDDSIMEIRH